MGLSRIEVYEVATFYEGSANELTTRDYEAIGTVTSGSKQAFMVSLDVQTGDYLGIFYQGGSIEKETFGMEGVWHNSGDRIPCTNYEFALGDTWAVSLYGYGDVVWPHEWNTKEISKWNTKEFTKWNGLE